MESNSRKYCEEMLPLVSRTFALGISLLHEPLFMEVGVSYLMCRICDSVEDTNAVPPEIRSGLLKKMANSLCKKDRQWLLDEIKRIFPLDKFPGAEYELLQNVYKVMEVYDTFSDTVRDYIADCVREMANGMAETVEREKNGRLDGLEDEKDIERYCYYVAGTVGKLLTKIFAHYRPDSIKDSILTKLREKEIKFALGLQLTNILKGILEDNERGVVYLHKSLLRQHNLTVGSLFANPQQEDCQKMVLSFVHFILPYLDEAVEYTLLIPSEDDDIRIFCALPVIFALRTLHLAYQYPESLLKGEPLKISRKEVKELHVEVSRCIDDNDRLRKLFQRERNL